jgi:uncharacterized protein (TIGR02246 family)
MTARTPHEVHELWLQAINDGDIDALMALYEPEATVVFGPDSIASGVSGIREGIEQLLALRPRAELTVAQVLTAGDLALLLSPWTMTGTGPDGASISLSGVTSDVVRRQPDGTWRFIIDNPTGSGLVGEPPRA